jgi:hypothetical protein
MKTRSATKIALLLIALLIGWFFIRSVSPYSRLRRILIRDIGVERLQNWTLSVLNNPSKQSESESNGWFKREDLPDDIRLLTNFGTIQFESGDPNDLSDDHILVACGNGFYHYGLRIGRPGYKPHKDSQFRFESFADGVWGMSEG